MSYKRFSNKYQRTSLATAGKMDLVIACYEKAIQCLHIAKISYDTGEIEIKANNLQKALNIINELQGALDFDAGGEISKNLDSLYSYVTRRLIEGDLKRNLSVFDESINILSELNEAWKNIAQGEEQPNASASSPSYSPENRMSAQISA